MTDWPSELLWVVLPYVSLSLFLAGHVYRYATDRYGWTAESSQLLEGRILGWASPLFHYGVLAALLGHVAGVAIPLAFYRRLGVSAAAYHAVAVAAGGVAGTATVVGLLALGWRRLAVARVRATSLPTDWLVLALLTVVAGSGWAATVVWSLLAGPYEYRATIGPWFRSVLLLRPDGGLMAGVPALFQFHVAAALVLLGVWPFTRLVHVWSAPLAYPRRATILYRAPGQSAAAAATAPGRGRSARA